MNKTEMKAFLRESNNEIRVDQIGDITVGIADKTGTVIIVSHDLDLPHKLIAMGAKTCGTTEENAVIGAKVREILDDRNYEACGPVRVHVERNGECRTLLLAESDDGSYGLPVCIKTSKLDIFRSEIINAAGPTKPIQIKGSDYWSFIFPIRISREDSWANEFRYIARQF